MPRSRATKVRLAVALATVVGAIGFVSYAVVDASNHVPQSSGPTASTTLRVGSVAPTKYLLGLLGERSSENLAALVQHRPTVINFFASWCPVCQTELDAFGAFSHHASSRILVVGIDTNDHDPGAAERLLTAANVHYPILRDTSNLTVALAYGIADLPVTFFISSSGRVVSETLGGLTLAELDSKAKALLAASPSA
jgi:thiol-disulfide isomerase/thioredoxin